MGKGCPQNGICKALKRYRITVKKDFRHCKADEEKRHEFLEVKSVYEVRLHPFVYIDESGTAMRHAGKNAQWYPDGARHEPTLSVPCVARCHLLSLPLLAAWTAMFSTHG